MHLAHHGTDTWAGTADPALVRRARAAISQVVAATTTPAQLDDLALRAAEQSDTSGAWYPPSLTHGLAGSALLHLYAARAGLGDPDTAYAHIREAVLSTQVEPLEHHGLFAGTSGLALALADVTRDEPRFVLSLDRLNEQLAEQVLAAAPHRVERAVSDLDYDLVTGAAGTLAHLCAVPVPSARVGEAVAVLVDHLVWLAGPAETEDTPHRWLITPAHYPPVGDYHAKYPHGYLNLGLSHGAPGVAAALAAAWEAGHRRPGHREAVAHLTCWIRDRAGADAYGPFWGEGVPVDEHGHEAAAGCGHDRIAWCYGTVGVAGALLTIAEATADEELRAAAVTAFEGALARAGNLRPLSPTLCHGLAGLVMLTLEFAPHSAAARDRLPALVGELLDNHEPARPLGFADLEDPGAPVDDPGLLTGATGVALTLLAALGDQRPAWFRAFLAR
ncbi:lanthionine synthetase C family protein [Streptomyces sp. TRM 70351]|uniref:lanthionine synthetase C family protein n=1 Tax=Streptomyces sp. TRM 70351 TaxID=3116552 RepID=UPI002E7B18E5|nr:lanthionine synthetase C family protein [Streptomyces sp. TRM 70351]MEE1926766.1 lanthionine synthetase C family protein [Streptomyces sp. TRM 70351]